MNIILSLLVFSFLIISHELGHFLLAKKNGVTVLEFSVGMGPRICSIKGKETKYSLKLVPFGGSCMMEGEFNEDEEVEKEGSFLSKSVGARISIIAAGPIFNFIFAWILAVIVIGSIGIDKPIIADVSEGYPAKEAGMQAGDEITQINDKKITIYRDITLYLFLHQKEDLSITYKRDGEMNTVVLTPEYSEDSGSYLVGIISHAQRTKLSPIGVLKYSFNEVKYWVSYTFTSLKMLVSGRVSKDDVSGPVGLLSTMSSVVEESKPSGYYYVFLNLANFCILLSANLGVMNLLPLPALDGGRLVFLIIEAVRGKPIDREKEGYVHMIGMSLLMLLMVFVLFNDILRITK